MERESGKGFDLNVSAYRWSGLSLNLCKAAGGGDDQKCLDKPQHDVERLTKTKRNVVTVPTTQYTQLYLFIEACRVNYKIKLKR